VGGLEVTARLTAGFAHIAADRAGMTAGPRLAAAELERDAVGVDLVAGHLDAAGVAHHVAAGSLGIGVAVAPTIGDRGGAGQTTDAGRRAGAPTGRILGRSGGRGAHGEHEGRSRDDQSKFLGEHDVTLFGWLVSLYQIDKAPPYEGAPKVT
jgi:hypothetical protein